MVALAQQPDLSELLRSSVLAALRASGYRVLRNIDCEVHGDSVTLSGVVPSFYLKQVAQAVALRIERVREVVNAVEVVSTR
jgi:osmotically-inducible protein OsmY